jgi:hypothetical protein
LHDHGGPVGIWFYDANNSIIQFCESYNNESGGDKDGGGFDFDQNVTNSFIQYCYSHNNGGGGQTYAQMEAKDYGGTKRVANITASGTYSQVSLANINVTNGSCTFGFYSKAAAGQWIDVDDVEFYKQ